MSEPDTFDVFLCHNSQDKQSVEDIARRLQARGLRPWLDKWELRPGLPWQRALEEQIGAIGAAAVFVGPNGPGPWQQLEQEAFLRQFVQRQCPVIPVILPGLVSAPELPAFLGSMTWVDFRLPDPDPMDQLIWGITGVNPGSGDAATPPPVRPRPRIPVSVATGAVVAVLALAGTLYYFGSRSGVEPSAGGEEMVFLPGGSFTMGSSEQEAKEALTLMEIDVPTWAEREQPAHPVVLDAFFMDKHEVTVCQYQRYLAETGRGPPEDCDELPDGDHPVTGVSWEEAKQYCQGVRKNLPTDLPTEAQWEYAARGGEDRRYPWGNAPVNGSRANFCDANCPDQRPDPSLDDDRYRTSAPVGSYEEGKSVHGVCDLAGNVAEWVEDWYGESFYGKGKKKNPVNSEVHEDEYKVVRGGSYLDGPYFLRAAARSFRARDARHPKVGFRCVLPADQAPADWPGQGTQESEDIPCRGT